MTPTTQTEAVENGADVTHIVEKRDADDEIVKEIECASDDEADVIVDAIALVAGSTATTREGDDEAEMQRANLDSPLDTRDGHCPYWRCSTQRTFERYEELDEDGTIVGFEYRCESCGRTHTWAQDNVGQNVDQIKRNRDERRRRVGRYIYQ